MRTIILLLCLFFFSLNITAQWKIEARAQDFVDMCCFSGGNYRLSKDSVIFFFEQIDECGFDDKNLSSIMEDLTPLACDCFANANENVRIVFQYDGRDKPFDVPCKKLRRIKTFDERMEVLREASGLALDIKYDPQKMDCHTSFIDLCMDHNDSVQLNRYTTALWKVATNYVYNNRSIQFQFRVVNGDKELYRRKF